MSPNRLPRLSGLSYRGKYLYFLTVGVYRHRPVFHDVQVGREVIEQLLRCASRFDFEVLAYCVMPDHVHALLRGTSEESDFRRMVHSWKQRTGFDWKRKKRERLWRDGYHERVLSPDEPCDAIIDYMVENPVRAGLVTEATEYELSFRRV